MQIITIKKHNYYQLEWVQWKRLVISCIDDGVEEMELLHTDGRNI